jgi:excisionase family DNA binding protein
MFRKYLLTPSEAAELLGVSLPAFRRLAETEGFPSFIMVGHRRRWRTAQLLAWLGASPSPLERRIVR